MWFFCLKPLLYNWAATWQNNVDVRPAKTDQPGYLSSLIRVFAVRMKKAWVLSFPLSTRRRLWSDCADVQAARMPSWVFAGRTLILLVLSCRGSYLYTFRTHASFTLTYMPPDIHVILHVKNVNVLITVTFFTRDHFQIIYKMTKNPSQKKIMSNYRPSQRK